MRKIVLFILLFPLFSSAYNSYGTVSDSYESIARRCKTIDCTSDMIRMIDDQISSLLAKRSAFVKVQGELKAGDVLAPKTLRSPEQQSRGVTNRAKAQGFNPDAADKIFKAIHEESNAYEQKIIEENK